MATRADAVNWRLALRVTLIITAVGLMLSGIFSFNRIACSTCWQDVTRYFFTLFGFITAFGYAVGWTLPANADRPEERHVQWKTRQGFWEGSLGLASLMSVVAAFILFAH